MLSKSIVTLEGLVDEIDWIQVQNKNNPRAGGMKGNEIQVGFYKRPKHDIIDQVKIRIGADVMRNLNWHYNDKICVFHHPDDYLTMQLVRTQMGTGYKLRKEATSFHGNVQFIWGLDMLLPSMPTKLVKFTTPRDEKINLRIELNNDEKVVNHIGRSAS